MRYWPWIAMAISVIAWFAYWEVRAIGRGDVATLSESLRTFTHLNPVFPYLVVAGIIGLGIHLYVRW